jgi:hypothetical protein
MFLQQKVYRNSTSQVEIKIFLNQTQRWQFIVFLTHDKIQFVSLHDLSRNFSLK